MPAIYKREIKSYFGSMIGYLFVAIIVAFIGIYFMGMNMLSGYPYFSYALLNAMFILLLAVPVLTMKSFAEERKAKTDQMLLTAPVKISHIVIGKYLAMATVMAIPMLIVSICPILISLLGDGFPLIDYASIFAFFLMGCVFIAIGIFISSLTESQIIAAIGTFAALLVVYLWPSLISFLPVSSGISSALSKLSVSSVFENFAYYNMFDLSGILIYVSVIFLFLFFTVQSIQKRRWS